MQGVRLVFGLIFLSLVVHIGSYVELERYTAGKRYSPALTTQKNYTKFKVAPYPDPQNQKKPKKQIVEAPLEKTIKPKDSRYYAENDHATKRQTKAKERPQAKALDPGLAGNSERTTKTRTQQGTSTRALTKQIPQSKTSPSLTTNTGKVPVYKPRNSYEKFLAGSNEQLKHHVKRGYQDYIKDQLAESDRIDLNTTEYRYVGYFTGLRKAIELVWNYPMDAARKGMEGVVGLEFAISDSGHASGVKVIKSSGYQVLDRAIVDAINLASPFSPLPKGLGKEKIVVTGSFHYALSYGGS